MNIVRRISLALVVTTIGAINPVYAQQCATDYYASAYARMHSPEQQDALQDKVLQFLEKGIFDDLNSDNYSSPLGYLLVAERNQERDNQRRGGQYRHTYYSPEDIAYFQESAFDESNVSCSVTEDYIDDLSNELDYQGREVVRLLLLGYSKSEIEAELNLYRGQAGRLLRNVILPVATQVAEN